MVTVKQCCDSLTLLCYHSWDTWEEFLTIPMTAMVYTEALFKTFRSLDIFAATLHFSVQVQTCKIHILYTEILLTLYNKVHS